MTNADFHKVIKDCMNRHDIRIYGFCSFENILPLNECRAKARLPENSQTVIVCAFPYLIKEKSARNLSYYACVRDYHITVMNILKNAAAELSELTGFIFEPFSDNSPVREVSAAVKAGIGVLGDNGLLITEKYGSYVFLGEFVTDMKIDTPVYNKSCLHCGMCQKKCRGNALENGKVNEDKCISAITQKKGELSDEETELILENGLAWGCDGCQTVCPMNRNAEETYISDFIDSAHHYLKADEVNERIKTSAYNWRGKKTILRNLEIFSEKFYDRS